MANHAEQACEAALKVQKMLAAWNEDRLRLGLPPLATRIGIHTGPCVVGNMGSTQRMNYTVMGDTVNLASRLEGLNKFFGTPTIVSGDCVAGLRGKFLCRHLAAVRVKGRSGAIEIFELRNAMTIVSDKDRLFVDHFEKGLEAYRAGRLPEAKEIFGSLAQDVGDVASKRYVQWINAAAKAPIGSDWDGVVTFDSK
jgi:adenylate cyclase